MLLYRQLGLPAKDCKIYNKIYSKLKNIYGKCCNILMLYVCV